MNNICYRAECSEKTNDKPNSRGLTPFGKVSGTLWNSLYIRDKRCFSTRRDMAHSRNALKIQDKQAESYLRISTPSRAAKCTRKLSVLEITKYKSIYTNLYQIWHFFQFWCVLAFSPSVMSRRISCLWTLSKIMDRNFGCIA